MLQELPYYTEYLDRNRSTDIESTEEEQVWRLCQGKTPYRATPSFVIPRGTLGNIHTIAGRSSLVWFRVLEKSLVKVNVYSNCSS